MKLFSMVLILLLLNSPCSLCANPLENLTGDKFKALLNTGRTPLKNQPSGTAAQIENKGIPEIPTPAPIGEYLFSGSGADSSGNGNHSSITGAEFTSDRFGNEDRACLFYERDHRIRVRLHRKIPSAPAVSVQRGCKRLFR